MYTSTSILALAALFSSVQSHGVILKAVGDKGASQGFLVDQTLARNCTTISPCQQDSTIIRDSEITQNIVNQCGRTEIAGNIDVGEQTENELAINRVTAVSSGTVMKVTIHQVNADGAGPYECDLDQTSNTNTNIVPLKVTNNVPGANGLSQAKEQDFVMDVAMPANFNCVGASTGNICTVRCRNTAVAGPFGGCFAVQQTDGTGRTNSTAAGVDTAQTLKGILAQVEQNKQDLPAAIAANQAAGAAGGDEGASAISALVTATLDPAAAATASATAAAGNAKGKGKGKGKAAGGNANAAAGGNANAAAGNANAATGNANAAAGNANAAAGAKAKGKNNGQNAAAGNANAAAGNANAAAGGNANAAAGNTAAGNANAATGKANAAAGAKAKGKNNGQNAAAGNANTAAGNANAAAGGNANAATGAANTAQGRGTGNKQRRGRRSAFLAQFGL